MGVPTSEVGYTAAMPRRKDHEVHKDMWWGTGLKKIHVFTHWIQILERTLILEGSQASLVCPSCKRKIQMKVCAEQWWNDNDSGHPM